MKTTPIVLLFAVLSLPARADSLRETLAADSGLSLEEVAAVTPAAGQCFRQSGVASFYDEPQRVACGGGRFNPQAMTAAHRSLPCGTKVRVTNPHNGRSVVVTINDRGPYAGGRVIDLSAAAFRQIANPGQGLSDVRIEACR